MGCKTTTLFARGVLLVFVADWEKRILLLAYQRHAPLLVSLNTRTATLFTTTLQYVCHTHQNNWKDAIIYCLGKSIETLLPPASIMELPLHLHLAICLILHTDILLPEALSTSNHYSGMQNRVEKTVGFHEPQANRTEFVRHELFSFVPIMSAEPGRAQVRMLPR